ncbi:UNVERIFIED_CONTAM: hypothetical protein ABID98_004380 [Brevibacillus sp. OAP136]
MGRPLFGEFVEVVIFSHKVGFGGESGIFGKKLRGAVTMPAEGKDDRLRGKRETAPQSHTLRGGSISRMICDAKDVSLFPLRLAGIVKAPLHFFPKIPSLRMKGKEKSYMKIK